MSGNKRNTLCMILAMTAPLAHYTGLGYMTVLLAAGAMIPLSILAGDGMNRIPKPIAALELIWLGMIMGSLLRVSGENWPGEKSEVVVPLTLLLLGVVTGNREKAERTCSTLFWILLIPALWILAVLAGKTEIEWLTPRSVAWKGNLIAVLLYPVIIMSGNGVQIKAGTIIALMAGVLAALIQGGIGLNQAMVEESPVYELGRCIGKGGFEIIISAVLTLSWYGFVSMGMSSSEMLGERMGIRSLGSRVLVSGFAILGLYSERMAEDRIIISGVLLLWILVPILNQKNKLKKDEKRC